MKINFDSIPKDKPSSSSFPKLEPGRYDAKIHKAEVRTANDSGNEYMQVTFITKEGAYVNENYTSGDKPFIIWKLGRLLSACDLDLAGEGTFKDLTKVLPGKKVTIDVEINDKGYAGLDFSGDKEGVYSRVTKDTEAPEEIAEEVQEKIQSNDDEF